MWSWDVITWPGHLATNGDVADGHVFAREPDMLEFFSLTGRSNGYYSDGAPSIDVRYWAEKLCGRRAHEVEKYDPDSFLRQVHEHLDDHENLGDTDVAMTSPAKQRDAILEDAKWQGSSESEAHRWLSEHPELFGEDTWEWDLREYDIHFLFACPIHLRGLTTPGPARLIMRQGPAAGRLFFCAARPLFPRAFRVDRNSHIRSSDKPLTPDKLGL